MAEETKTEVALPNESDLSYVRSKIDKPYFQYGSEEPLSELTQSKYQILTKTVTPLILDTLANPETLLSKFGAGGPALIPYYESKLASFDGLNFQRNEKEHYFLQFGSPSNFEEIIFWVHGGCRMFGVSAMSNTVCARFMERMDKSTTLGVSLHYPLAPFASNDEQIDFLCQEIQSILAEKGVTSWKIGGSSAGADLTLGLAFRMIEQGQKAIEGCSGIILGSPWNDFGCSGESFAVNTKDFTNKEWMLVCAEYLVGRRNPAGEVVEPDRQPSGRVVDGPWGRLPPTAIFAGGCEIFLDDALFIGEQIHSNGGRVVVRIEPYLFHDYLSHHDIVETATALDLAAAFFAESA